MSLDYGVGVGYIMYPTRKIKWWGMINCLFEGGSQYNMNALRHDGRN